MSEPDLFDELRGRGIDADDPEIRAAVRVAMGHLAAVRAASGDEASQRCLEAMHAALAHAWTHPATDDMTSFEDDFDLGDD